jgi:hypothetical protein
MSFMPQPLHPSETAPSTHHIGGRVSPRAGLDEETNILPLSGIETKERFLLYPDLELLVYRYQRD